ncbi:hypothetical protein KKG29_02500 [Patescibacteria group bacterium]|nr:hypothetical protein [Patescibacteria group bacterium]
MRIIAHLDMDAFFAAVEERDNPQFKGMPIAVGADPGQGRGRGVVSTANYKAREYGIHSALPISVTWRLSESARKAGKPSVIFLPVDIEKYAAVSEKIMDIVKKYSPKVISRLAGGGFKSFRTVVVTVRFADFQTQTRSHTLDKSAAAQKILEFEALKLLSPFLDKRENPKGKLIRLIGVRVEKLNKNDL